MDPDYYDKSLNDFADALMGKSPVEAIEILPTQVLDDVMEEASLDLHRALPNLYGAEVPMHLDRTFATSLAWFLAYGYDSMPEGTLYSYKSVDTNNNPHLNISRKHSSDIVVPDGWDAVHNGVFCFFTEQEVPVLRVMDPTVSLWVNKDHVVMDLNLWTHYTFESDDTQPNGFNQFVAPKLEKVIGDKDVQVRDYRGSIGPRGEYDLTRIQHVLEDIEKYLRL